jgi:hypothetical protein
VREQGDSDAHDRNRIVRDESWQRVDVYWQRLRVDLVEVGSSWTRLPCCAVCRLLIRLLWCGAIKLCFLHRGLCLQVNRHLVGAASEEPMMSLDKTHIACENNEGCNSSIRYRCSL